MRIGIVSDSELCREALKEIISKEIKKAYFVECKNSHDVINNAAFHRVDAVLLDVFTSGQSWLSALRNVIYRFRDKPVVVLNMSHDDTLAWRAIKEGAKGYLCRKVRRQDIARCLQKVLSGEVSICHFMPDKIPFHARSAFKLPHEQLSPREYEIMCLIANGKTPTQIARLLSLSVKTVSTHRTRLLEKMELKNNSELMRYAIRNHLVE